MMDDSNKLPSGVTTRSRRRRKQKTVVLLADQKENEKHHQNQTNEEEVSQKAENISKSSTNSRKRATNNKSTTTTTKTITKSKGKPKSKKRNQKHIRPESSRWISSSPTSLKHGLKQFCSAVDKVPIEEITSWREDSLSQCLIEASCSISQHDDHDGGLVGSDSSSFFYLIQDQESNKAILSTCRKVVKWASENKGADPDSASHALFVAVHALRAMLVLPQPTATTEAILRLLYHIITTSSSIHNALTEQKQKDKSRSKTKLEKIICLSETVCLTGYDALCFLLLFFSVRRKDSSTTEVVVIFDFDKCSLFPLPTLLQDEQQPNTTTTSDMKLSQLFTICAQSSLAVARLLVNSQSTGTSSVVLELLATTDGSDLPALTAAQARAVNLLRMVGLSWASFMSQDWDDAPEDDSDRSSSATVTKEVVSLCQQGHRILWDLALRVSKQQEHLSKDRCILEESCARLRQTALLILLGYSVGNPASAAYKMRVHSRNGKLLCSKHFESVCSMATKTAVSLQQQHTSSGTSADFHASVGSVLDEVASKVVKQESFAYTEYCAYRALHVGEHVCSCQHPRLYTDTTSFPFAHTLRFYYLCLQLRTYLESILLTVHDKKEEEIPTRRIDINLSQAKDVLLSFKDIFLCTRGIHAKDLMVRCLKIVNLSSLPSTLYKISILSSDDLKTNFDPDYVSLGAEILSNFLGPFLYLIVSDYSSQGDTKKDSYMWDQVVESYARAAVIWDALGAMQDDICSYEQSNEVVTELCAILVGTDESAQVDRSRLVHVEKAAKIFASIGKRRANRGQKQLSLLPLLYSLSLFTMLERERQTPDQHLLARWDTVASVFQSLGWKDAAALATAETLNVALAAFGSIETSDDDVCLDLLGCLGSYSCGTILTDCPGIPVSKRTNVLIRRLVESMASNQTITTTDDTTTLEVGLSSQDVIQLLLQVASTNPTESYNDGLLASSLDEALGVQFSLGGLLRALFVGSHNKSLSSVGAMIRLLCSFMSTLGKMAQRDEQSAQIERNIEMFEEIVNFIVDLISSVSQFVDTDESTTNNLVAILRATAHIAAACALLSESEVIENALLGKLGGKQSKQPFDHSIQRLRPFAERFAKKASEEVTAAPSSIENNHELIYSAVRSATMVFEMNMLRLGSDETKQESSKAIMEALDEGAIDLLDHQLQSQSQSRSTLVARLCYSGVLSRVRDRLSLLGDYLSAAQVSLWHKRIVSHGDKIEQSWINSTTTNLFMSGGLLDAAFQLEMESEDAEAVEVEGDRAHDTKEEGSAEIKHWSDLVALEEQVASFRLQVDRHDAANTIASIEDHLNERLNSLSVGRTDQSDAILALSSWVASSILLVLSCVAEVNGDLRLSLSLIRSCYQRCQEIMQQESMAYWSQDNGVRKNLPWSSTILQSLVIRSFEKQIECLQRTAILYASVGDYRRSEAYSIRALEVSDSEGNTGMFKPKLSLSELLSAWRENTAVNGLERVCRRRALWFKATSATEDSIMDSFQDAMEKAIPPLAQRAIEANGDTSLCEIAGEISELLIVGNLLCMSQNPATELATLGLYNRASQLYIKMISTNDIFKKLSSTFGLKKVVQYPEGLLTPLSFEMKLVKIRSLLMNNNKEMDADTEERITSLCLEIAEANTAPKLCKAWALYMLGLIKLKRARETGALFELWSSFSNMEYSSWSCIKTPRDQGGKSLKHARKCLYEALTLLGPASNILTRSILRALALATGPERDGNISSSSACILIHTSIGSTARQSLSNVLAQSSNHQTTDFTTIIGALDSSFSSLKQRQHLVQEFLNNLHRFMPMNWRFVASTVCPTGEILVTSIVKNNRDFGLLSRTVCIFASDKQADAPVFYSNDTYDSLVKPLDALILKSQQQLRGARSSADVEEKFKEDSAKRGWWKERKELDNQLQELLENIETNILGFGASCVKQTLFGHEEATGSHDESFDSSSSDESTSLLCGNLTSKFEAASLLSDDASSTKTAATSTDASLPRRGANLTSVRSPRLSYDSDESTESHQHKKSYAPRRSIHPGQPDFGAPCTFLILDENLHRIPFEGLPSFRNQSVCRVPSLSFPLSSLYHLTRKDGLSVVNPANASYILDPEANLNATRERLLPFVESLQSQNGWQWNGVVGESPSPEFMKQSLMKENGLLLYCGHGGGQNCFSRSQLEDLMEQNPRGEDEPAERHNRSCRSSVILMGCSSGRLQSVNHRGGETLPSSNYPIYYEPDGIALSYLLAGAPCVVGNLWDVTDADCDRYCQKLLKEFLDQPIVNGRRPTMAEAVAVSRSACKMPYIVGCAPVIYGVPVEVLPR